MIKQRDDAWTIINESIKAVMPEEAVEKALRDKVFNGDIVVAAIGKAAWNMAYAAKKTLGDRISKGVVVTKYEHSKGNIEGFDIIEAGHPVPDENSVYGAGKIIDMVSELNERDNVVFLISGGGSALFVKPMDGVSLDDIMDITKQLLDSGADITEINTIRKHLSAVKGGRFAEKCNGAKIYAVVLSDVVGDRLDTIASGPAYADTSTSDEALAIIDKYKLNISENIKTAISIETPKSVDNCETVITGSVTALCGAAKLCAERLGYNTMITSTSVEGIARDEGAGLAEIAGEIMNGNGIGYPELPCAIISGGETVVKIIGDGKGGRNQELSLSAAIGIEDIDDVVIFSVGSDGTDGPTDAAGGMVDGKTVKRMKTAGISPIKYLDNNDSYNALMASEDLVITGSTGTNVNDLMVMLCGNGGNRG